MALDDYQKCSRGELERDAGILIDFVHDLKTNQITKYRSLEEVRLKADKIISEVSAPFEE